MTFWDVAPATTKKRMGSRIREFGECIVGKCPPVGRYKAYVANNSAHQWAGSSGGSGAHFGLCGILGFADSPHRDRERETPPPSKHHFLAPFETHRREAYHRSVGGVPCGTTCHHHAIAPLNTHAHARIHLRNYVLLVAFESLAKIGQARGTSLLLININGEVNECTTTSTVRSGATRHTHTEAIPFVLLLAPNLCYS